MNLITARYQTTLYKNQISLYKFCIITQPRVLMYPTFFPLTYTYFYSQNTVKFINFFITNNHEVKI